VSAIRAAAVARKTYGGHAMLPSRICPGYKRDFLLCASWNVSPAFRCSGGPRRCGISIGPMAAWGHSGQFRRPLILAVCPLLSDCYQTWAKRRNGAQCHERHNALQRKALLYSITSRANRIAAKCDARHILSAGDAWRQASERGAGRGGVIPVRPGAVHGQQRRSPRGVAKATPRGKLSAPQHPRVHR
jgi:hypothetical protein